MAFIPESIFRNHDDHHHNLFPASSPQDFHGVPDFMMRRSMSFSGVDRAEEFQPDDDGSDDGSQLMLGEKKRRLNLEQVKALEKSFDSGNKLEPERKMQLARALGLQPRQIAIWFQNRRARWKTKQLEKDYDVLKRQFEALKADNDALKCQNKSLQTQLLNMKSRDHSTPINLNKDNEGSNWSNGSENSCDHEVNLNAINSTDHTAMLYRHHNRHDDQASKGVVVFPTSAATTLTHLVHGSSRQDQHHHPQKHVNNNNTHDQTTANPNDHCFGSVVFGGIEENPEFWPWPEQQNFQ